MLIRKQIENMVREIDPKNFEFIMNDVQFESKLKTAERFEKRGDKKLVELVLEELKNYVKQFDENTLTPANVKVGDGVTMRLYTDAHAGTVVKVTKTSVTVQRDKATLDPNWKPKFVAGGFAGHCINQDEQTWIYERDPNGETITFRWSKKYNQFRNNKKGLTLYKGRREFYDYNF